MPVNLDCMPESELMQFWNKHKRGMNYRALFPAGGRGTKAATADLANYASNRHAAIGCRLRGDIVSAQMYESICERIYVGLPEAARW